MHDTEIIRLYWNRDQKAITQTDAKYGSYCRTVADRILACREDTEECVNDTWLKAWQTMPPEKPDNLRMYLARITRNLAFDRRKTSGALKRGGGEMSLVLEELSECLAAPGDVQTAAEYQELEQAIQRFLRTLTVRDRDVFLRRYFFAESIASIAQRYAIGKNNVSAILSRARQKLKIHLIQEGYTP